MEGEAAAAILQVLVQNLIDASKKEISLFRGLDKDAEKLTDSLHTIQKFLNDAEMRTIPGEAVKNWLMKLEDAAFDADNVLDELNYHLLSKEIKKAINPTKQKVLPCFSFCTHVSRSRKMAVKIKEISENLDSINKNATELGLVEKLANVPTVPDVGGSETDSYTLDPIFIGRDHLMSEIVEEILGASDERVVSILSIVGMGGMGKTTLTRKVFNHERIEAKFGSRIWVHVSQNFDPIALLKKILKKFMSCDEGESREDIMRKLKEALKDKVYLLVLDDVWNDDAPKWEDFINSLMGVTPSKGNAIVVTTRNTAVASIVNPLSMHQLEGLTEEDCWSIIKEKTFGKGVDAPSEIESIGRKIAGRCQGLPLAANVVGGVLQRDNSEDNWLSIERKWLSHDDGGNITRILRLSFDSLSSASLKKCFAYCSMFPKGDEIKKQELIEQWMAEGFLQPDDGSGDMESVGEKFINILLHSSLLQVLRRDDGGNVEICSMHDLLHDLARSVLGTSDRAGGSSRLRYKFLDSESSPIDTSEMKYCRTLVMEYLQISGTDFSHFECLHVLTLRNDEVKELPSSIKKLIHLRKLNISDTCIEYLPDWIGELHYLQTLRAEYCDLEELPSTIKYLTNMRHLYLNQDTILPAGIGELTCLQTLRYFGVGDENDGCKIEELGSLNDLKGELQICNLERVRDNEEAAKANLFRKSKIMDLGLRWDESREGEIENDENVLEGLQPHVDLKKLLIWGFKGKRFPAWAMKMAVQNVPAGGSWVGLNKLTDIELGCCTECEEIPMMGHLPNLKSLKLEGLSNVKRINSSGMCIVFPALERLVLEDMPKLAQVESDCGSEVFPRLQYLVITGCQQLTSVGTHSLPCLKYLRIRNRGSSMLAANLLFQIKYGMLAKLFLVGIDDLESLPDVLFNENPNLSKLEMIDCPKLREVPAGLLSLSSSLEELKITSCPLLESITGEDYSSLFFTSLRIIEIKDCNALVWLAHELVGPSLEELHLESLSSLKNLPNLMEECMARSPRLNTLTVVGVPIIMATSREKCQQLMSVGTHSLPCLRYLRIGSLGSSMPAPNLLFQIKYGLLANLYLFNISDLECLPDVLFNENPNLSVLEISKCPKLRELAPGLLTLTSSLQELHIEHCPLLERIAGGDGDGGEESQSVGLGSSFFSFTSLRIIEIKDCNALVWLSRELVGPSLDVLHLESLSNLKNLPNLMDECMARSPRLNTLRVVGVPKFMGTSGWRFGSLRRLDINASDVEGTMETVDGILQGCLHSLMWLTMRGTGDCDRRLPESIQRLTALDELVLKNYGMEELPEWLGNLSSLEYLHIHDCRKLRRLPSMDAMSRLQISGCPELLAQGVADPEWPKVSHISTVLVDGTLLDADSDVSGELRRKHKCLSCNLFV